MSLFVKITRPSFDVKFKAPGFDICQKFNENVLLTHFFVLFFACVLLKGIFQLFRKAVFRGLVRFAKSSIYVDIGFNGSVCIFPLLHF